MLIQRINSYSIVTALLRHSGKLIIACVAVLAGVAGCTKEPPLHPSYEELTQRGFYVYILPEREIEQRGWSKTILLWSWNHHCKSKGPSEYPNPISIDYHTDTEEPGINILIGPWDIAWDRRESVTEVQLETPWAKDGVAEYYRDGDYVSLKFKDRFEIPVQVSSRLSITEVISLINQLEYVGPPPETVTNPWDYSKCSR